MSKDIIGIDFGSYSSCVAVFKNNVVDVVANENGNRSTPSVVAYLEGGETLVGDEALSQIARNTANTIYNMKSIIGQKYADVQNEKVPFAIVKKNAEKGRDVAIEVTQAGKKKQVTPENVTAAVFTKLKEIAEHSIGTKVSRSVLAVPAYFTEEQKRAIRDASVHAGLEVLRIIPEPVAVVMAKISAEAENKSAQDKEKEKDATKAERHVIVFDHGGASLNVSLVTISPIELVELKANHRDTNLGGGALDNLLVQHFVSDFTRKNRGADLASNARAMAKLRIACERAKKSLSTTGQASVEIDGLYEGRDYNGNVSRARFEDMAASHLRACLAVISKCLEEVNLSKQEVSDVIMVGGGARVPIIQKSLSTFFEGKEVYVAVNPEESIAMGAAHQGIALGANVSVPKELQAAVSVPATQHSIGLSQGDGTFGVVLPRGTVLPARKIIHVSTYEDNQSAVFLQVYEGEKDIAAENTLLGRFAISGIKPAAKGEAKIKVKFEIDNSQNLNVSAETDGATPTKLVVSVAK